MSAAIHVRPSSLAIQYCMFILVTHSIIFCTLRNMRIYKHSNVHKKTKSLEQLGRGYMGPSDNYSLTEMTLHYMTNWHILTKWGHNSLNIRSEQLNDYQGTLQYQTLDLSQVMSKNNRWLSKYMNHHYDNRIIWKIQ